MVYVDAPVWVWMCERLSSKCWDVTTISGMLLVASVGSATAMGLKTNSARAAGAPDGAATMKNLDIKRSPQKLKEAHRGRLLGRRMAQGGDLCQGGWAAASRSGNGGVECDESRLRGELRRGTGQRRGVKRVAESGGNDLRKRSTQRARCVRQAGGIDSRFRCSIGRGEMTQLVVHSTLLRHQQQQQKSQCFEHVSHSAQRLGNLVVTSNAIRIGSVLQLSWH
jgi:hypothetical protein